jgi:glutamine amidotransferase
MPIGNLQSAWNAFNELGFDPRWADENSEYDDFTHLVMPGVGHFGAVMNELHFRGLPARIRAFTDSGRPLLGICIGMQLLADVGMEGGETQGLGLLRARVERLPSDLRLPHVGWSTVTLHTPHPITEGIKSDRDFYFVHSYAMTVAHPEDCVGETNYGRPFVSIVGNGNIVGCQFHPEKSQINGLKILENFCRWDGRC